MSKSSSCSITVYIDKGYATGLVQKAAKKVFFADHDKISDTIQELCHFLEDHRGDSISQVVIRIDHRLGEEQVVRLFRHINKVYREIAKHKTA